MRVGKKTIKPGTVFDWDIEEILTRRSVDFGTVMDEIGYSDDEDDPLAKKYEGYHEAWEVEDQDIPAFWERLLDNKRNDDHYEDVETSLKKKGFVVPLSAYYDKQHDTLLHFGDGHHRLAAAISLGMKTVPVKVYERWSYDTSMLASNSGEWRLGDRIEGPSTDKKMGKKAHKKDGKKKVKK